MKIIGEYIKKNRLLFVCSLVFLAMEAICDILQPTFLSYIIDRGIRNNDLDAVIHYGTTMLGIALFGAVNALMRNYISSHVSFKIAKNLRTRIYKKILYMPANIKNTMDDASLMTRLTNDVTITRQFINGLMRVFLKAPLLGIGSIIMVLRLYAPFVYVYLVVLPLVAGIILINMRWGYPLFGKVQTHLDTLNHQIKEFLGGIRIVKAFNRYEYETLRFSEKNHALARMTARTMKVMALFSPIITWIIQMSIVVVIYLSGDLVASGNLEVGITVAFINYMMQFLFACMIVSRVLTVFVRAKASAERIEELLNAYDEDKVSESDESMEPAKSCTYTQEALLVFEGVDFSYDYSEAVLHNISFTIMKHETVGIIGSTGSGKSSLMQLILGFYPANNGRIVYGGLPIKAWDVKVLRRAIGWVPQKAVLFSGTLRENICFGNTEASMEDCVRVAKIADIHNYIKALPKGYDTIVGRGGMTLSGGQKQRLSIARALLKNPQLLILDDATSALDVMTERQVLEGLSRTYQDLTKIVVSQRISSIRHMDKIIVMDYGRVVGIGSHDTLAKECCVYQEIMESQWGKESQNVG